MILSQMKKIKWIKTMMVIAIMMKIMKWCLILMKREIEQV